MPQVFADWVKIHGLDPEKDMKLFRLGHKGVVDGLKIGQIDAAMMIAGIPTALLVEVSTTIGPINIIQFHTVTERNCLIKCPSRC